MGITLLMITSQWVLCETIQDNDTLKSYQKELKRKARISYRNGFVYDAIDYYQSYIDLASEDVKSTYRLAYLYYQTRNYELAHAYFDTVIHKQPKKYPLSLYYNGQVLMSLESYEEATENFLQFRRAYRGRRDPEKLRRSAQLYLKNAEWAENHIDSIANVTITHLNSSINQPHIEFGPVLYNENALVYGSLRPDSANKQSAYRKLYTAKNHNGEWQFESSFDDKINKGKLHTGNAVFAEDGTHMYFTRCEENWQGKTICSIYKSENIEGQWQEPEKLPYPVNDDNYTSTQPAIGNNLRRGTEVLYFVSDRPGGKGGLDIWYTEIDTRTGEYRDPRSLGRSVNSYADECCPYYDMENRTLYYSSKGHPGFGGFDIFKSTGSRSRWTDASPLPKPINSPFDDTYFIPQNSTKGLFTSNRSGSLNMTNGSCCDDIYAYKYNECIKVSISGKVVNQTSYDFFDELNERYHLGLEYPEDGKPVEGVSVFVYHSDSVQDEVLVSQTKTNKEGIYDLELDAGKDYSVIVKNYGLFDKRIRISTKGVNCLDTLNIGLSSINYIPEITVRVNVYYGHDKSKLTKQAQRTIDTAFMPLFDLIPNAIIEIGSHTDSTGSDSYNIKLSQRRSESVVNYLVDKGISMDRLIAKGYGESRPIAPNTNPDGTDNPHNRQLNRRTELKIVGEISSFYIDE